MSELVVPSGVTLRDYSKDQLLRFIKGALQFIVEPETEDVELSALTEVLFLYCAIAACDEYDLRYGKTLIQYRKFISAVLYFFVTDLEDDVVVYVN